MSQREVRPAARAFFTGSRAALAGPMAKAIVDELREIGVDVWSQLDLEAGRNIVTGIIEVMKSCDFVIVDLTEPTDNVMLEVGFFLGVRKPVIMLVNGDKVQRIPSDLAGYLYYVYSDQELESFPPKIRRFVERDFLRHRAA